MGSGGEISFASGASQKYLDIFVCGCGQRTEAAEGVIRPERLMDFVVGRWIPVAVRDQVGPAKTHTILCCQSGDIGVHQRVIQWIPMEPGKHLAPSHWVESVFPTPDYGAQIRPGSTDAARHLSRNCQSRSRQTAQAGTEVQPPDDGIIPEFAALSHQFVDRSHVSCAEARGFRHDALATTNGRRRGNSSFRYTTPAVEAQRM